MRGEILGANLPLFWNNDGKDRPKGQICLLAKKEVFKNRCCFAKKICRDCWKVLLRLLNVGIEFGINSFRNRSGLDLPRRCLYKVNAIESFLKIFVRLHSFQNRSGPSVFTK